MDFLDELNTIITFFSLYDFVVVMFENVVSAVEVAKDPSYRLHKILQAKIGFVLIIDVVK